MEGFFLPVEISERFRQLHRPSDARIGYRRIGRRVDEDAEDAGSFCIDSLIFEQSQKERSVPGHTLVGIIHSPRQQRKMVSSSEFPARFAHASAIVKTPRRARVARFSIPSAYCTFALKPFGLSGKLSGNGLALCGTVSRKPRASTPARRAGDRVDSLSCCNSASEAFSASNCTAVWRTKLSPFSASRKIAARGKSPHLSKSPISAA